jgi:type II secretory pathway component PulJ
LYERLQEQVARIEVLEAENAQLQQQVGALEARLVALEAVAGGSPTPRLQVGLLMEGGILVAGLGLFYWLIRRRAAALRGGE